MNQYFRSTDLIHRTASRLLIVDMQERLLPVISGQADVLSRCVKLVLAAQLLQVPVVATEQYPKGLGPTVPELAQLVTVRPEKLRFSSVECLNWTRDADRPQVILAGIEAHVCVLQTAVDLVASGFQVFVVADAVGSRHPLDADVAIKRMASAGVTVTTTESVLFEWCEVAGTPEFKQISSLVKELGIRI